MLLDKNGKIKGKFSIVDAAVIVLVLAVIAGICVRYSSVVTSAVKSDAKFKYVICIPAVRSYTVEAIKEGDNVTDKKSENVLGKVVGVYTEQAKQLAITADGKVVNAVVPDRSDCYVVIEANGKEIATTDELLTELDKYSPGDLFRLKIFRAETGDVFEVDVVLIESAG